MGAYEKVPIFVDKYNVTSQTGLNLITAKGGNMALYTNLPIYKDTYVLLNTLTRVVKNMPRDYRRLVGEKINDSCVKIITLIYNANVTRDSQKRYGFLLDIKEETQILHLFCRLSKDMGTIDNKKFGDIIIAIEGISKQTEGWSKHTKKVCSGSS